MDCSYFISPRILEFVESKVRTHGPGMAGSLFGAGWCFWLDAVLINGLNSHNVPFVEYLPGIVATGAMILVCIVRRSSLGGYDAFDSASYCRQRFWLFIAYVVSFASIIGAAAVLLKHMAEAGGHAPSHVKWIGWAEVLQVTCILGSGLILFSSRGDGSGYDDGFYTAF